MAPKEQQNIEFLLTRITLENSREAFTQLFNLYFDNCYNFALRLVKSKADAEEVVLDVFHNLWQKRHLLADVRHFNSYLFFSVRNKALRYIQNSRATVNSVDPYELEIIADPNSPEDILLTGELKNAIRQAIDQLPEKCRLIFCMVREEGLKYSQVAEILEISERTVNAQMTIAVRKIGESLKQYFQ